MEGLEVGWLEVGWLEAVLEKWMRERSVDRILDLESDKALGPGENYTSDILRVQTRVTLGSGRIARASMIAKKKCARAADLIERYKLFDSETRMYSVIFPLMEGLMNEFGDTNYNLWADYFGSTEQLMLFDDLKAKGFKMVNKCVGQDFIHARLTMKNIGRFHAMSVVLVNRGAINTDHIPPSVFTRNDDVINKLFCGGMQMLADTIETTWDAEWKKIASKLRLIGETAGKKLQELYHQQCDGQFKVLNHGDFWTNNMLFKYEQDTDYPIEQRFVDYQCSHYASYAWDILNFFHSSLSPHLRLERGTELLSAYQKSLASTLAFYGCEMENVPSLEAIEAELDRHVLYAMIGSCTLLPMSISEPDDAFDISDFTDSKTETVHNRNSYANKKYIDYIETDLKHFINKGAL